MRTKGGNYVAFSGNWYLYHTPWEFTRMIEREKERERETYDEVDQREDEEKAGTNKFNFYVIL